MSTVNTIGVVVSSHVFLLLLLRRDGFRQPIIMILLLITHKFACAYDQMCIVSLPYLARVLK